MSKYSEYFGFKGEPFSNDIPAKHLLQLPDMVGVKERMDYIINLGGIMVVTGDVGAGKSTALRWGVSHYHPSETVVLEIIANGGTINELYKQLCWAMDLDIKSASRAYLVKSFRAALQDLVKAKKQRVILILDEASLLRAEIFAELHTISQFDGDSKNLISIVLAGQAMLLDKLTYRSSAPLASRVLAKTHLSAISLDQMREYISHHLKIAGVKKMLFSDTAVTAIQQGSGGLLRKANFLAKGGLVAAAIEHADLVTAEHIRIAATELI